MNPNELLERRADRGEVRGASIVWADAQLYNSASPPPDRSNLLLRIALAAFIIGLVWVVFERVRPDTDPRTADQPEQQTPAEPTEPLPDPILVTGMELERVTRPFDPDFDSDDIFDRLGLTEKREPLPDDLDPGHTTVVFADEVDPLGNPILGVELLDGGGFLPWTANLGDLAVNDLTKDLEQRNGEWTMSLDSGLVEVARFEDEPYTLLKFGWEFEFADGDDKLLVHAESIDRDVRLDEWIWIARLAAENRGASVSRFGVLDEPGVMVDLGANDGEDIVWLRGDFVYRLRAFTQRGNDVLPGQVNDQKDRLHLVDRAVWLDAVEGAEQVSSLSWTSIRVYLLMVLSGLLIVAVYLRQRSAKPAEV